MPVIINPTYAAVAVPALPQLADIQYACTQWALALTALKPDINMAINVEFWAVDMTATGLNGMCIPGIWQTANSTLTRPQAKRAALIASGDTAIDLVVVMDNTTPWVLGAGPAGTVAVGPGQYSLATTMIHELCHGLGFVGLCNVDNTVMPNIGIYTDVNLIAMLNGIVGLMNPPVIVPAHFFPPAPVSGIAVATPFAVLGQYASPGNVLVKGVGVDDYVAFMTANDININSAAALGGFYTLLTGAPFQPFTSCDHITGGPYLMNSSTVGQYYAGPDAASLDILSLIGW